MRRAQSTPPVGTTPENVANGSDEITDRFRLMDALQRAHWNRRCAAELLGISYSRLLATLRKYELTEPLPDRGGDQQ